MKVSNKNLLDKDCEKQRIEKKRSWKEVQKVLYKWFKDYGDIDIVGEDISLTITADYSCPGKVHVHNVF